MSGNFDFGLSEAQEQHARQLHEDSISIDLVSMGPGGAEVYERLPQDEVEARLPESLNSFARFTRAMALPYELSAEGASDALQEFCAGHTGASYAMGGVGPEQIRGAEAMAGWSEQISWMNLAHKAEDFRRAHAEGTYVTYGNVQPSTDGLPRDLGLYPAAFELGVRAIMLTYNNQDYVGSGCTERHDGGLSNFGKKLLNHLNNCDFLVDTSHCGKRTTLDACLFSDRPVMANHTAAEVVFNHDRAKSDEELEAIAATGGIVGVYALPFFLAPPYEDPTFEVILDNIDYIVKLIGWEHVAIGTDWPFMMTHHLAEVTIGSHTAELGFRPEHNISVSRTTEGYEDARDFINFTRGLVSRGYTDEQIKGILGENFLKLFEQVCG